MLNWWLGRPVEGKYCQEDNPEPEPPETPAPVFAARALKSAIFGTPAPLDETIYEHDDTEDVLITASKKTAKLQSRSTSPTKPQGILLTPGTATTRRKTVSFGNDVAEREEKVGTIKIEPKKGQRSDSLGKVPTPWASTSDSSVNVTRKTSLTRTLENAREGKPPRVTLDNTQNVLEQNMPLDPSSTARKDSSNPISDINDPLSSQPLVRTSGRLQQPHRDFVQGDLESAPVNGDATMDLNEPHSQSGKYWKSEYEQYHAAAKAQMERLINYKVLAKSFAKMKDDEAIAMTQKLEEEQQKVVQMEKVVSQLSAKIANPSSSEMNNSPEMIKDLARQTALALQYRAEVEEFRTAMENSCRDPKKIVPVQRRASRSSKAEIVSTNSSTKTDEHLGEVDALSIEIKQLRLRLVNEEEKNAKLQKENAKLIQDLLHAELRHTNHLEKCEQRRDSLDGQLQRKDERLQNLQKDFDKFKDIAKKSRRDAELLLRKRHDQMIELKKEISSLSAAESTAQELKQVVRKQILAHEEAVTHFQEKNENRREVEPNDLFSDQDSDSVKARTGKHLVAPIIMLKDVEVNELSLKRESQIPVLASISRPMKAIAPKSSTQSEFITSSRPRSSNRVLSEIVNGASIDTIPPERYGPVQHTPIPVLKAPLDARFSNTSPGSPDLQLPSPEPSLPRHNSNRTIHERNCLASPRPSMFNIKSSPPKAAFVRPRTNELTKQRSSIHLGALPVSSIAADTSRVRREMAPDRLAAAKARLDQKKRMKDPDAQREILRN